MKGLTSSHLFSTFELEGLDLALSLFVGLGVLAVEFAAEAGTPEEIKLDSAAAKAFLLGGGGGIPKEKGILVTSCLVRFVKKSYQSCPGTKLRRPPVGAQSLSVFWPSKRNFCCCLFLASFPSLLLLFKGQILLFSTGLVFYHTRIPPLRFTLTEQRPFCWASSWKNLKVSLPLLKFC